MREVFEIDIPTSDESDIDIQDGNNSGFESDESNENSNEMSNRSEVSEIKIKKGRPKGTKRARDKDENESGKAYPTKKQKTKPFSIDVIKAVYCCTALCLCSIDVDSIKALRDHIGSFSKQEMSQWILDWLWTHPRSDGGFCFMVGEWSVCLMAFLSIIGLPLSTYYTILKKYKGGVKIIDKPGRTGGRPGTDSESALAWLHFYAIKYAEQQPDQVKLHLPPCLTKGSVYMMYTEEMTEKGIKIISISHFYLLWRKCLNFISIPQQSTFSKCDICTQIKTKLSSTKDKAIRAALQKLRHNHLRKQSLERRKYHKHAMKARLYPEKYVSIIIDGMDQKKTQIPHLLYISSFIAGMWKLRTHLVGAIVHGVGVYGFFDYYQYPHGSNLTIHVLLSILFMIRDSLPEVLYLQMDNCGRENKNRYVLALLCLLVRLNIFRKVKISFLMVGHTHEDIDQVFSRFSVWLKTHSATTLPKLMNLWEQCFTPKPTGILTENVYDVAGWLQGHINPISGHSKPHTFRITKENDKVKLVFKKWTNDAVWIESKGNKELLENIPSGYPKKLEKISDANIDAKKLENDVNKVLRDYVTVEEDKNWWDSFFESLEKSNENEEGEQWMLDDIIEATEQARRLKVTDAPFPDINIDGLADQDDYNIDVIIGKEDKNKTKEHKEKEMEVGKFCLTNVPSYAGEWPQVGQLIEIKETKAIIQWWKGSKSGPWSPCTIPAPGLRGKRIPWTETINSNLIWLHSFNLTTSNKLPLKIKDKIDTFNDF